MIKKWKRKRKRLLLKLFAFELSARLFSLVDIGDIMVFRLNTCVFFYFILYNIIILRKCCISRWHWNVAISIMLILSLLWEVIIINFTFSSIFYFFSSIEMQVVNNGNVPLIKQKTINKEKEKILVLIMNEMESNSI